MYSRSLPSLSISSLKSKICNTYNILIHYQLEKVGHSENNIYESNIYVVEIKSMISIPLMH